MLLSKFNAALLVLFNSFTLSARDQYAECHKRKMDRQISSGQQDCCRCTNMYSFVQGRRYQPKKTHHYFAKGYPC